MSILSPYIQMGFHTAGSGGNPSGIGDHIRALHQAGRPVVIVCVDGTVGLMDALADPNFHEDSILVWRFTYNDYQWMYGSNMKATAQQHWDFLHAQVPLELLPHKAKWWFAFGNEMRKEDADWVHGWSVEMMKLGNAAGFKMLGPNWAAGTPEPEDWNSDQSLRLLRYLSDNPKVAALGLHEYSYVVEDLFANSPSQIGRYQHALAAAHRAGLNRPNIIIKEFGWEHAKVPSASQALAEMHQLYLRFPDYPPAGTWYLGPAFGGVANETQRLIGPYTEWQTHAPAVEGREVEEPPITPGVRCGDAREPYDRLVYRVSSLASLQQFLQVARRAFLTKSTLTFSPDDAGIGEGLRSKSVVEVGEEYPPSVINPFYSNEYCVTNVRFEPYELVSGGFTNWPTEFIKITQAWNSNPGYYSQWYGHAYGDPTQPLNGHGGVDIRAPHGSRIFSAWPDGVVTVVERDPNASNFGIHVRVTHQRLDGEYVLIYGHMASANVSVGQQVPAGYVLGRADNTGNSYGSHLHFAVKKRGATDAGTTTHPSDLIDPTPMLEPLMEKPGSGYSGPPLPTLPLIGLHGRANRHPRPSDHDAFTRGGFTAAFIQTGITAAEIAGYNASWYVCRIFESFEGRSLTPQQFVDGIWSDFNTAYQAGVRHFVAGNEPNIDWENPVIDHGGEGIHSGRDFGRWLMEVHRILRGEFQEAQFGWPALSPGFAGDIGNGGWREEEGRFLDDADSVGALGDSDFITCHSYYLNSGEIPVALARVRGYRERFNSKWVLCTEYGSPAAPDPVTAGKWANQFRRLVSAIDNGTGAFYFLVSGSGWENWAVVDEAGNDTGFINGMLS